MCTITGEAERYVLLQQSVKTLYFSTIIKSVRSVIEMKFRSNYMYSKWSDLQMGTSSVFPERDNAIIRYCRDVELMGLRPDSSLRVHMHVLKMSVLRLLDRKRNRLPHLGTVADALPQLPRIHMQILNCKDFDNVTS